MHAAGSQVDRAAATPSDAVQRARRSPELRLDDEHGRVLNELLNPHETSHGFAAVDDAVIIGQGGVHHRPQDDLAGDADGPFLNRVQAEDGLTAPTTRRETGAPCSLAIGASGRVPGTPGGVQCVKKARVASSTDRGSAQHPLYNSSTTPAFTP